MRSIIAVFLLMAMAAIAMAIKPVDKWPKEVILDGAHYYKPVPVDVCVAAGYRLKPKGKPETPAGKRIFAESIIQDPDDPQGCVYDIIYEDIPEPPAPPPPEVTTNIVIGPLSFEFTINGWWTGGIKLIGAPGTN